MYLCYIDESGTSAIPGNTSHFVLVGLSIPIWHWKDCERDIAIIKRKYALEDAEIHTAWILRKYIEQVKISGFKTLRYNQRRSKVSEYRRAELLRLQKSKNRKHYRQTKKNYAKTDEYIHLTLEERQAFISEIAGCVSDWGFARLFGECIDKIYFDPSRSFKTIDEQTFEQLVSRFEKYLQQMGSGQAQRAYGLLIHDNNQNISKKHTKLMRHYHQSGTLWTELNNIIETPLFVDSKLTSMVQIADLCGYAIRRYLENQETDLFDLIFRRADRKNDVVVGVRHFTHHSCTCTICLNHKSS